MIGLATENNKTNSLKPFNPVSIFSVLIPKKTERCKCDLL